VIPSIPPTSKPNKNAPGDKTNEHGYNVNPDRHFLFLLHDICRAAMPADFSSQVVGIFLVMQLPWKAIIHG
jgi:hypothetical protein